MHSPGPRCNLGRLFRDALINYSVRVVLFIIWQGKSERSDWFFFGGDFAIQTVSVETVISCVFFVFESRQTQNKDGASAIQ